jgi:flagellar hook-associated protein 2
MAGLTLGGLASGMDTNTIITQLMAIEGQGKTRLLGQQYRTEARKTALDQIATKLRALKTATEDMRSVSSWKTVQTVTSSDTTKIAATFKEGAAIGAYSIEVSQLARAEQRFFTYGAPNPAATTINFKTTADPLDPTQGDPADPGIDIAIPAGADANAAAAAINAKSDSPAYASVVGGQLVLSGKKTGTPLFASGSQLTEDAAKLRAHRLAEYKIDGGPVIQSASNTVTGLTGVEMTLKSLTTGPVTVEVGAPGPDQTAMKAKVKAFVDAYNSTIDLVKSKLEEQTVKTPTTQSDYGKGVLRGDPGLSGLLSKLRVAMGEQFAGNPDGFNELSDIGVGVPGAQAGGTSSPDRLAGKLVIDDAKLTAALTNDPNAVRRLLGGIDGAPGATQRIAELIDPVSRLGDGDIAQRTESITREVNRIKDAQVAMDRRLKLKEERLRAQFTAMETALNASQANQSWLTGQINGMAASSSS